MNDCVIVAGLLIVWCYGAYYQSANDLDDWE